MKANIIRALIWAAVGFGNGWVWSDYIIAGVRFLLPEKEMAGMMMKGKSSMKPFVLVILGLLAGCEQNQVIEPPLERISFSFRAWNYSTSYYFVDTLYRRFYETYYTSSPPIVNPPTRIVDAEVWVQRVGFVPDPREFRAIAYIALSRRDTGYDPLLRGTPGDPGRVISAPFIRLAHTDYELTANGYLGVIRLNTSTTISNNPISDEQTVAIAYRCADSSQYGEFIRDVPFDTLQKDLMKNKC